MHYGDLAAANANADRTLANHTRLMAEPAPDATCQGFIFLSWPWMLYYPGPGEGV